MAEELDIIEVYAFLDTVRETGKINMLHASPYIETEFEVDRREARRLLFLWINREYNRNKILGI